MATPPTHSTVKGWGNKSLPQPPIAGQDACSIASGKWLPALPLCCSEKTTVSEAPWRIFSQLVLYEFDINDERSWLEENLTPTPSKIEKSRGKPSICILGNKLEGSYTVTQWDGMTVDDGFLNLICSKTFPQSSLELDIFLSPPQRVVNTDILSRGGVRSLFWTTSWLWILRIQTKQHKPTKQRVVEYVQF